MPFLSHPTVVDFLEAERDRRAWGGQLRRVRGARIVTNPRYRTALWANQILVGATEPPVDWEEIRAQAEPTFRALGIHGRRAMLFGEEVGARLGRSLLAEGFLERPLWLLSFQGIVTARPGPEITIRRVDPFLRAAWLTLSYRIEEERGHSGVTASDRLSSYSSQADQPGRRIFAAFMGDTMAGSCDLSQVGSLASIEHVQTAPEWRGQGVATTLVLHATEEAVRDGARGVRLTSHSQNLVDQLYRPCGFATADMISILERRPPG